MREHRHCHTAQPGRLGLGTLSGRPRVAQLDELEGRIAASRASVEQMERTRGELIQEARQISVQMERSREKLSRCRTEREANAAQREIEELRKIYGLKLRADDSHRLTEPRRRRRA